MLTHIKVPAIVGAVLTALVGVLTALTSIPAVALYAAAIVSVANTLIPLLDIQPGLTTVDVPAIVGVVLTAISGGLVALEAVPAAAIYATAAVAALNAVVPLFRYDASGPAAGLALKAAASIHPKVRVPAVVGTLITIALGVLSVLANVPATAAYASAGVTVLQFLAGYLTPAATKLGQNLRRAL